MDDQPVDIDAELAWRATLGPAIWRARTQAKMTIPELAEELGVSRSAILRWQSNKRVPGKFTAAAMIIIIRKRNPEAGAMLEEYFGVGPDASSAEAAASPAPPPHAPAPAPAPAPASPGAAATPSLDDVLRAAADDADITAGRLRRALVAVLSHLDAHGIPSRDACAQIRDAIASAAARRERG